MNGGSARAQGFRDSRARSSPLIPFPLGNIGGEMPRPDSTTATILARGCVSFEVASEQRDGEGGVFSSPLPRIRPRLGSAWLRLSLNSEPYGIPRKSNADITRTRRRRRRQADQPSIYADSIKSRETGEGTMVVLRGHRALFDFAKPVVSDFSSSRDTRNGLRSERFPFCSLPLIVRNSNVRRGRS